MATGGSGLVKVATPSDLQLWIQTKSVGLDGDAGQTTYPVWAGAGEGLTGSTTDVPLFGFFVSE